ncbi:SDR family oxidoreductase [Nonomuraea mesophila]|uniref:SDR family oxidoreductase n=1 Tax=Nonomuraea mesophila TaxID=2530382 RepID=A0A4R5F7A6_9ACTN|nr:SDR family oxidoreductase [Nonomuraea mesophila]TDE43710.1 SDR family oxidoreductase [Nonomuraea mesophila]
MSNALESKAALVTGGSRGIGAAVALRLAQDGADVALTYQHNKQRADDVVAQIKLTGRRAIAVQADSSDPAAVTTAVDRVTGELVRLDILVITIGSNVGERVVFPGFTLYPISKTALIGLTRALGRELGPRAITVNVVNPGPTDTDMNPADGPNADAINGFSALGHYAEPADVAATVAFLAGPGGRYITGATVSVDGGFNI